MTREEIEIINTEMHEALKKIAEKHNLKGTKCNLSWNNYTLSWKLEARTIDESTGDLTIDLSKRHAAQARLYSKGINYNGEIFGEIKFVTGLGDCKIMDFSSRSPKYPFIVMSTEGKSYKVSIESIHW